ncbi:MAG: hypothetical protein ACFE89_11280 [Candidatus Hodarchaeota archaeon]
MVIIDEEGLRRIIENHLENAEEHIREGRRQQALGEFEEAASLLEAEGELDQLEMLWAHAATGFTAAAAPFQAGFSFLRLADLEAKAGRRSDARDSYLSAANSFFAARDKSQELWTKLTQALEKAIELTLALDDPSMAIELLFKCAMIHYRETGYTFDAINCLERAQQLTEQVPTHPLKEEISQTLQHLIDRQ